MEAEKPNALVIGGDVSQMGLETARLLTASHQVILAGGIVPASNEGIEYLRFARPKRNTEAACQRLTATLPDIDLFCYIASDRSEAEQRLVQEFVERTLYWIL